MAIRNWCYDTNIFQVEKIGVPVISVGNMTAGGTGKTPMVEYLIRFYLAQKKNIAVISRGYKRSTHGMHVVSDGKRCRMTAEAAGDEPYQIAKKFPAVTVIVDEKRTRAARVAVSTFSAQVILLDDAFQHRSIERTLDIVMIDGSTYPHQTRLLPAGLRREHLSGLQRAHVLVVSNNVTEMKLPKVIQAYTSAPVFTMRLECKKLKYFSDGRSVSVSDLNDRLCIAFAGIGNPDSFKKTIQDLGISLAHFIVFGDHHPYSMSDFDRIREEMNVARANLILTTEKDAMRLTATTIPDSFPTSSLIYMEVESKMIDNESQFHGLLMATLRDAA
jgi:tetraacyldisaccharide 4'-kinase